MVNQDILKDLFLKAQHGDYRALQKFDRIHRSSKMTQEDQERNSLYESFWIYPRIF